MWGAGNATNTLRRVRFDALMAEHTPTLLVVARRMCREDPAAAADLVQDTLERAWRRFDSLQNDDCARPWLVKIMRHLWLDHVRRRRPEVPIEDAEETIVPVADEPSRWERVTIEDIRQQIELLPEPFRTVAVLHDIDGKTYREISDHLKIPYATAATRLHRAHQRIKELVLGLADDEDRS
jgi:RNA polymerase sigma-70 factor (ECF subfamily)